MKKIKFTEILPHAAAVIIFLLVTIIFFSPVFFENKVLSQSDIQQHRGSTKDLYDYREATGQEGLWASRIFSGMPAYLVSMDWDDQAVVAIKKVMSLFLVHPVCNIFLCIVCYYILLLSFRIRPWLAIAGAIAFGLSSYMVIGLSAGHNARIGAIAFIPLVMAGIHLAFSGKKILGFGVMTGGLSLHLRENHPQMTYYLLIIVIIYGLIELIQAIRAKQLAGFFKTIGLLAGGAIIAASTFLGQLWAISEFTPYSYRGASELVDPTTNKSESGLGKSYAFQFSYGLSEPMTLIIPNFLGGSSSDYFVQDQNSNTYKALVNSGNQQMANQLAEATSAYWGDQPLSSPYYAGAIVVFLFVLGIFAADRKMVTWLVTAGVISIFLCWGSTFSSFNYFLFDYLPGYNKFRSVTFALVILLFSMPLLGLLGLEKIIQAGWNKDTRRKITWTAGATIGFVFLLAVTGGFGDFLRPSEAQLPAWFRSALFKDRVDLFRADAWRSFWFMTIFAAVLFAYLKKWAKEWILLSSLLVLSTIDITRVDKRYIRKEQYQRKERVYSSEMWPSEKIISQDTTEFRFSSRRGEGGQSFYFRATGGYSGARLRRYEELMDSVLDVEFENMGSQYQATGKFFLPRHNVMSMLNVKYFYYGQEARQYFKNDYANGSAWFVRSVVNVGSANEELETLKQINTLDTAVVNSSKFRVSGSAFSVDSTASIRLVEFTPPYIQYESNSPSNGFAVFSEIYYPKGWHAKIDGAEVPIIQADYVLRALEVPAGKHKIEFSFEPKPYIIGNKITLIANWLLVIIVAASLGYSLG